MFNWVRIFCGFPHIAGNLMQYLILSLNVFVTMQRHRLGACWKIYLLVLTENTNWLPRLKYLLCFVSLLGPSLLLSLRGGWEQWVKWFTGKISEGGFRWSAKLEVTKRSGLRAAFQRANVGWIGLFLFHPRGNCPPKCIACNISDCLDYIRTHIYCILFHEWPWPREVLWGMPRKHKMWSLLSKSLFS